MNILKQMFYVICASFCIVFAICIIPIFIINLAKDFSTYQSIMEGTYDTPWYSQNWLREPYTNFRLSFYPSLFHIATNADHSQIWIEKEKKVGNKTFWTIDYKMQMTNVDGSISSRHGDPF